MSGVFPARTGGFAARRHYGIAAFTQRRRPRELLQAVSRTHMKPDRKSTRLHSSHVKTSYAVFRSTKTVAPRRTGRIGHALLVPTRPPLHLVLRASPTRRSSDLNPRTRRQCLAIFRRALADLRPGDITA